MKVCKQNDFSFVPGSASCQCISSFGGARVPTGKYGQIDLCIYCRCHVHELCEVINVADVKKLLTLCNCLL